MIECLMNKFFRMLRYRIYRRTYIDSTTEKNIVDQFHKLYYELHHFGETWHNTFWLGIPTKKCPLDLWIYQEMIYELKPDVIIETGTANGGSALFLASLCDIINNGRILTVDIQAMDERPRHKRIEYLLGSSVSEQIVQQIRGKIVGQERVMVILDSDHHKEHVQKELEIFSGFVTKGSYLIVEDTNLNGHPVHQDFGPGPMEAVQDFLKDNRNFVLDKSREKFRLTFNPQGYLRKEK